ncbi:hypothetical protein [Lacrimispora sp.]|uniref:hypothetical protein n=1 Tax=Lacrimispora sp. TaxID=2719234 RepID=UPI0028AB5237|nr:hypothetical protein [Lacrimispora sp.]
MDFHEHREIIKKLKRQIGTLPSYDILNILLSELQYTMQDNPDLPVEDRDFIMTYSGFIKKWAVTRFVQTMDIRWDDLYWKTLHFEAPYLFESYLIYLEKNREAKDRFYLPKRKQLNKHGLIQAMQDLEDDRLDILSISMPPGTQKTTLEKFFASWVIGSTQMISAYSILIVVISPECSTTVYMISQQIQMNTLGTKFSQM